MLVRLGSLIFLASIVISFTTIQADDEFPPPHPDTEYNRLLDYVFKVNKYNPVARPVQSVHNVTEVSHQFAIQQIINIDVKQEQMTVLFWQRMTWVDSTISWRPEDFGNISHFTISPHHIWIPDIVVYNRVGNFDENKKSTIPLMVYSDGRVKWNKPMLLISTCNIHIRHFPYDRQRCDIKIGSWIHSANEITINNNQGFMDENHYILNGEWHLVGTVAKFNRAVYDHIPYTDVTYSVHLQRRPKFYEKNIVIPTALISLLATLVFLLPPESGEKIGLSITVFLALCVNLLLVAEMMPATSLETPIIGEYYLISISMVAMSLVATVVVLNVHNPHSNAAKPPRIITFIFFDCIGRLVFMTRKKEEKTKATRPNSKTSKQRMTTVYSTVKADSAFDFTNGHCREYYPELRDVPIFRTPERISTLRHPANHSDVNINYLSHEMNFNRIEAECQVLRNDKSFVMQHSKWNQSSRNVENSPGGQQDGSSELKSVLRGFDQLLKRLDTLVDKSSGKDESDRNDIIEEWHFLARVLDRLFAILSIVIILVATIVLIYEARNQVNIPKGH
ncbi:neuronal acetylcholine receptor subunit beta-4-like [Symsagittifera roscoffensis]|uniref:neuronal acetylcholine receptor subunit beta-4-like n=1 Tax=Symsagittifera roscoffensis TaxID=84072 RepID=UPI00307B66F6